MAKPNTDDLISKITGSNKPDFNPQGQLIRLDCVKVASGNYRRSEEIILQAAELAFYVETGAISLGKPKGSN
jgi:hypothetical protein